MELMERDESHDAYLGMRRWNTRTAIIAIALIAMQLCMALIIDDVVVWWYTLSATVVLWLNVLLFTVPLTRSARLRMTRPGGLQGRRSVIELQVARVWQQNLAYSLVMTAVGLLGTLAFMMANMGVMWVSLVAFLFGSTASVTSVLVSLHSSRLSIVATKQGGL